MPKSATATDFAPLFARARAAGLAAGAAVTPLPMHVVEHANPLDDASPVVKRYAPVMDGVCGFAWVTIRPGNSAAARYAKKHLGFRTDHYAGGVAGSVFEFNQSLARKEAYAEAYAAVLREAGIKASAGSRID